VRVAGESAVGASRGGNGGGGCWLRSVPGPRSDCAKSRESAIKQVSICFLI
jgi:hypothetical protein